MTAQAEIVRQSDLLNQLVIDRQTLEELGRVETLWMYPPVHRVLGFICKSGFLGHKKAAFKLRQIAAVGASGVLTHAPSEPTEAKKVQQLESLLQHEVWSNEGNQLGKITDYLFELDTGKITAYLFVSSGWAGVIGEVYELRPTDITSFGKKRVLVAESDTDRFAIYQEGISQKLTKAKDSLTQEASEELRSLTQRAETLTEQVTEQVKERFLSLTDQAKERAQMLSQKAKEKAQTLNEQLGEQWDDPIDDAQAQTRTFSERARETSQTLAEEVRERSQSLSKQLGASFQTLTVQAEEIFDAVREGSGLDAESFEADRTAQDKKDATQPSVNPTEDWDDDDWLEDDWLSDPISPNPVSPNAPVSPNEPIRSQNVSTSKDVPSTKDTPNQRHEPDNSDLDSDLDDDEPWI
ncbi:MAG: PRC-barrel domain-containing protein [Oscillatoriophycideae cyanobacterium NC_groundwater_1537_Pr4_S-0.65um_50_18]|nr:PRC-barrel domain-containing protein [Oscillatoriophycideae cyanobacterium NC_groundwater_1537_Pr4_S-0.65um_50_18]